MTKDTFSTRLHPLSALRATSFEMLCKRMNDRLIAKLTIFPVIKRSKLNDKKKSIIYRPQMNKKDIGSLLDQS